MSIKRADLLAVLVLAVLAAVFFHKVFLGLIPVPSDALIGLYHPWRDKFEALYPRGMPFKNFLTTDPVRQQIPWRKIAIDQWKTGELPGWNPYNGTGSSLAANVQSGAWYPFNLLFSVLDFPAAWTALIVLQPLLATVFMYVFLRNRNLRTVAAGYGAVVWGYGGFAAAWMTWGTIVQTAVWLPLSLYAIDRLVAASVRRENLISGTLLSASVIMMLLAGHAQIALYCLLAIAAYLVWVFREHRSAYAKIFTAAAAMTAAIAVSSVQLAPFISLALRSARVSDPSVWRIPGWFIPWQHLAQFLAPDFFGNPSTLNYWGVWNYGEFLGYSGIFTVVLVLVALYQRRKEYEFFFWLLAAGMLVATPNPVSILLARAGIPVWSAMQPTRILSLVVFTLAVLSAAGLDSIRGSSRSALIRALIPVGLGLSVLWSIAVTGSRTGSALSPALGIALRNLVLPTGVFTISGISVWFLMISKRKAAKPVLMLFLTLILTADLFRMGWKFIPFTPAPLFYSEPASITYLKNLPKPFRVAATDLRLAPPNSLSYYGIESVDIYDPLYDVRLGNFMEAMNGQTGPPGAGESFTRIITVSDPQSPFLRYANVTHILSLDAINLPGFTKVYEEGRTKVYKLENTSPRFYLAGEILQVSADNEALELMKSGFAPGRAVLTGRGTVTGLSGRQLTEDESVSVLSYAANSVKLRVRTADTRLLVNITAADPGWTADVDGQQAFIIPVNYLFQGVAVPAGDHLVSFRYNPVAAVL
ncbi:hypothetical protein A2Z33_02950 [Candidatus Gottesmanbacteria bacterium RBG_16_52_11]|uniref:YfhO family protein n=1 Tax=Candidatus Gottesmanbacteria bacterium RBG_16_52_11 TaxID=1798374 RepID=A0A1F5YMG7_9BACT|nr:MAG: hypothetical protein A2Z33_02950 [Candidatus Gottesmanbacteria bacterium RBG_16_52_11]